MLKSYNWPFTAPQRRANPAVYVAGNALFYNDFWCPPVLVCFAEAKRIPFLPPPESLDRGGQLQKSKKGDSLKTYCKSKDRWKGLSGTSSKTNRKTMNFELGEKGAKADLPKRYCKSKDRQRRPQQNLRFSKVLRKRGKSIHQKDTVKARTAKGDPCKT